MSKASRSSVTLDEIDLDVISRLLATGCSVSRVAAQLKVSRSAVLESIERIKRYVDLRGVPANAGRTGKSGRMFHKLAVQAGHSIDTLKQCLERAQ